MPTRIEYILVTHDTRSEFVASVNVATFEGFTVVPGTLVIIPLEERESDRNIIYSVMMEREKYAD